MKSLIHGPSPKCNDIQGIARKYGMRNFIFAAAVCSSSLPLHAAEMPPLNGDYQPSNGRTLSPLCMGGKLARAIVELFEYGFESDASAIASVLRRGLDDGRTVRLQIDCRDHPKMTTYEYIEISYEMLLDGRQSIMVSLGGMPPQGGRDCLAASAMVEAGSKPWGRLQWVEPLHKRPRQAAQIVDGSIVRLMDPDPRTKTGECIGLVILTSGEFKISSN